MHKLLNYTLGGWIIEEDSDGSIISKNSIDPVEVFNETQALEFFAQVRRKLHEMNSQVLPLAEIDS